MQWPNIPCVCVRWFRATTHCSHIRRHWSFKVTKPKTNIPPPSTIDRNRTYIYNLSRWFRFACFNACRFAMFERRELHCTNYWYISMGFHCFVRVSLIEHKTLIKYTNKYRTHALSSTHTHIRPLLEFCCGKVFGRTAFTLIPCQPHPFVDSCSHTFLFRSRWFSASLHFRIKLFARKHENDTRHRVEFSTISKDICKQHITHTHTNTMSHGRPDWLVRVLVKHP